MVVIVVVEPAGVGSHAFGFGEVGAGVGPLLEQGAVEPLDLGSGSVADPVPPGPHSVSATVGNAAHLTSTRSDRREQRARGRSSRREVLIRVPVAGSTHFNRRQHSGSGPYRPWRCSIAGDRRSGPAPSDARPVARGSDARCAAEVASGICAVQRTGRPSHPGDPGPSSGPPNGELWSR